MYVYIWKHNETPFYVGMSKTMRRTNPLNSGGRGWLCKQTLAKIGPKNVVVEIHTVDTVDEAKELERSLIEKYGRIQLDTGTLTNLRPGGDGAHGMSDAGKAATSKRMKENNPMNNQEIRAKAVARMNDPDVKEKFLGKKNPAKRPEVRAKIRAKWEEPEFREHQSKSRIGKKIHSAEEIERRRQVALDPNSPLQKAQFHKVLNTDPEIKKKRVAALLAPEVQSRIQIKLNDPEKKAQRIAKLTATLNSPEYKEKHGKHTEETKAKMSESAKLRWAKRKGLI